MTKADGPKNDLAKPKRHEFIGPWRILTTSDGRQAWARRWYDEIFGAYCTWWGPYV